MSDAVKSNIPPVSPFAQIAFDHSPEMTLVFDKDNLTIIDSNLSANRFFGYDKEEFLSLKLPDIVSENISDMVMQAFRSVSPTGNIETIEAALLKKDNSSFEAELKLQSAKYHEKTLIVASIKEREIKSAAKSKSLGDTLPNYVSDVIVATDYKFNVTCWNNAAEKVFGWQSDEVLGKGLQSIFKVIYNNTSEEQTAKELFENGSWTGEVIHHRKNGDAFPASVSVSLIKDENGNDIGIVGVIRDISKQKEAEKKIGHLAEMVDKVTDAIISADKNYIIKSWNNGAKNIYGYEEEELLGRSFLNIFNPEITAEKVESIYDRINRKGFWKGEGMHYTKEGKKVYMLLSASPLCRNGRGEIIEYVLIAKDISERKELEDQVNAINDGLALRVKEKTAELTNVLERITDAFVAVDKKWCLTYMNKKGSEIFSYGHELIVGKNIWEEFPRVIGKPFYLNCLKAFETQQSFCADEYYQRKNQWFEYFIYPSPDGLSVYFKDITERKTAEEKLIASEKLFKSLMENSADGVALLSDKGIITYASRSTEKITGVKKEDLVGLSCHELVMTEDVPRIDVVFDEIKKHASVAKTIEYKLKKKGENRRYIEGTYNNLLNEPYVNAIVLNFRDISERKNAENELKKSEARYKLAQAQGKLGHWELNLKDNTLFWSEEVYKIFDINPEEKSNDYQALLDKIHPDDVENFKKEHLAALAGEKKMNYILRIILNNGSVAYVHKIAELVKDTNGYPVTLTGMAQDVTEQKIAEQNLVMSKEQYRVLFERSPLPMWIFDKENLKFLGVNLAAIKHYGYTKEEFLSMNLSQIWSDKVAETFTGVFGSGSTDPFVTNSIHRTKGGNLLKVEVTSNSIQFENKDAQLALLIDRTEQKRVQEELIVSTEQLRELASHLQNIREEERTGIAREIHDELGQKLTGLKMDLSWLNRKLEGKDENINNKIKGSLELIDSTIATVRKIAAELRPGILDDLGLAEAIEWHSGEFEKRSGVKVDFSSAMYDIKLPPDVTTGIYRIFQEALTNVARHANASCIQCTLQKHSGYLRLTVSDNGVGFDNTAKGKIKTLGLLGMKERVTILNGKYEIKSEPGKGTTVLVKVPLPGN